jgi:hypothetical protein
MTNREETSSSIELKQRGADPGLPEVEDARTMLGGVEGT